MNNGDSKLSIVVGVLTGFLILPILANLGFFSARVAIASVVGIPILWSLGLLIIRKFFLHLLWIYQVSKFVMVGFLNTAIDFGVLNLLSFFTGVYDGKGIILINSISFLIALLNSYFWNKYWTFDKKITVKRGEFLSFVTIGLIGMIINTSLLFLITSIVPYFVDFPPALLENLAKVVATVISLIWNFLGYKFIVFKA